MNLNNLDMRKLRIAIKAAKKAGKIHLKYFRKENTFIKEKNPRDVLTKADLESEKKIISIIEKRYPDHSFLAEESGKKINKKEHLWVIDPLDGTSHFFKGNNNFCAEVSYVHKGQIQLGVIYFPVTKELFIAKKGEGATCNGRKLKVSDVSDISDMYANTQMSSNLTNRKNNLKVYSQLILKLRNINASASCCGRMLCQVADGISDFHFRKGVHYWDYAAGILLIEEAGGKVTDMDKKPITINSKHVVASNGKCHNKILKIVNL